MALEADVAALNVQTKTSLGCPAERQFRNTPSTNSLQRRSKHFQLHSQLLTGSLCTLWGPVACHHPWHLPSLVLRCWDAMGEMRKCFLVPGEHLISKILCPPGSKKNLLGRSVEKLHLYQMSTEMEGQWWPPSLRMGWVIRDLKDHLDPTLFFASRLEEPTETLWNHRICKWFSLVLC